jgi:N utilization substance protein A
VVNGTVKRFENGDIILEIGRIEAVLPRKEQSRAESYSPADRVRTVIKGVNRSAKGPQIVLSRTDSGAAHQAVRAGGAGESTTAPS